MTVPSDSFADAALVLLGHGSLRSAEAAAPVYEHAEALRRRRLFAQVLEGFWKLEPSIAGVLRGVYAPRVFLVPVFISEGYFTQEVLPRELGLRASRGGESQGVHRRGPQTLVYTRPIGTQPAMVNVVLDRAREVIERHPFPRPPKPSDIALILAGHGTTANENSRQAIEAQAARLRALGRFGEVHAVFLEEDPRVGDCYTLTHRRCLVVVPYFISDGPHSRLDVPRLLGEPERMIQARLQAGQAGWRNPTERHGKLVWYAASVGTAPSVAEVILECVREAARQAAGAGC